MTEQRMPLRSAARPDILHGMSYYVTTPIYYVNAEPHLGHAYTTIGADILARHMRQRGERVFYLTGTDEHGEPVSEAADRLGTTPRELADKNVVHFKRMVEKLEATNDFFIRTTDTGHVNEVKHFLEGLHDRGEIYPGTYEGWYCPNCADFKTEQELEDGRCPIHKVEIERETEENYFFRLSKYQEPLERLYADHPDFVLPKNRYNEALGFIKQGLTDISMSRAKMSWGVPLPWDENHVAYVWFDALLNYVSALKYAQKQDLTETFWPATLHVMAKDILKFHAVVWPAMLMAAGVEVPKRMFIHGYLLMGGEKMSKTLGNVLDPFQVIDIYGADALRYYLFREVSFGQDGSVSTEGFEARYNTELANELGNLANRTFAMVRRYLDGRVSDPHEASDGKPGIKPVGEELGEFGDAYVERFKGHMDKVEITAALELLWTLVRRLNRYVEETAPWNLAKQEGAKLDLEAALYNLVEGLRALGVLLYSYLPATSERLLGALGRPAECPDLAKGAVGSGPQEFELADLKPLFPKLEDSSA